MADKNQAVVKKVPQRRCVGCNGHFPKNTLVRVLRTSDGDIILDLTGKKSGRGAYICKTADCLKRARKSKRIEHSLECIIPDEIYNRMEEEINRD